MIRYSSVDNTVFEVIAFYCPNEENDTWVKYRNAKTGQEYTCRREAFEARYNLILD